MTPALRGRIKIAAFQRGLTVADMLRASARPRVPRPMDGAAIMTAPARLTRRLTHVELIWLEKRIEHWIRFGRDVAEQILDRRRRILSFAPDSIFALSAGRRTTSAPSSRASTSCARSRPAKPISTVPFVRPGGEILLRLSGWPKVERVLAGDRRRRGARHRSGRRLPRSLAACPQPPRAGDEPRPYSRDRHRAWLLRRRIDA